MADTDKPKKSTSEKLWGMLFGREQLEKMAGTQKQPPPPMQNTDYLKASIKQWQDEEARKKALESKSKGVDGDWH